MFQITNLTLTSKISTVVVDSVVVHSLLIVTPIVGFCSFSMFCCALLCVHSSFAIISMGESWFLCFVCLPGVSR